MPNVVRSSGRDHTPAARPRPSRPALEVLEDRLAPATIFVHNFNDGASTAFSGHVAPNLRSAIEHSHTGDTIALDNGTYLLTAGDGGDLPVDHNLVIANNQGGFSTIDGQGQSRVFTLTGPEAGRLHVTMTRLKITRGDGNGSGQGGGLFLDTNVALTLNDDVVTNNFVIGAPAQGGGIDSHDSTLVVNDCVISQNRATGTTDKGPGASAQGAGIYSNGGLVVLANSTLAGNVAVAGENDGAFGEADGGGLFLTTPRDPPTATVITGTTFANNVVRGGSSPTTGAGSAAGGGLYQDGNTGAVFVSGSTFSGNQAVGGSSAAGGGNGSGGALFQFFDAGNLSIFNSTFAGNAARGGVGSPGVGPGGTGEAGGLSLAGSGTERLVNDTIARNVAASGGAGGAGQAGGVLVAPEEGVTRPKVWNTLIAENVAPASLDVDGAFLTLGHNLIGLTAGSTGFSTAGGDLLNVPGSHIGLGNLAHNGGPTQTLALALNSIAIDHGDDAVVTDPSTRQTTDQRGFPRKAGAHVDIGAFESVPSSAPHGRRNGPL
jgi:hypothetical protein